jgi:hypothetical protein
LDIAGQSLLEGKDTGPQRGYRWKERIQGIRGPGDREHDTWIKIHRIEIDRMDTTVFETKEFVLEILFPRTFSCF